MRKGGIAEGPAGFSSRHREFFLFPTFFHEQLGKVRTASVEPQVGGDKITLRWYATVKRACRIDSLTIAEQLAPLHILSPDVVRERFGYKDQGLNVALVRIFEISPSWVLPSEKRFGGCRSWVDLPQPCEMKMRPVLDEETYERVRAQFDAITSSGRAQSRMPLCNL